MLIASSTGSDYTKKISSRFHGEEFSSCIFSETPIGDERLSFESKNRRNCRTRMKMAIKKARSLTFESEQTGPARHQKEYDFLKVHEGADSPDSGTIVLESMRENVTN